MVTAEQKRVIDSVLSLFETGQLPSVGAYSTCNILSDGAGISYGKHQSTDRSGSLDKIVDLYVQRGGVHANALKLFQDRLAKNETATVSPKNPPAWVLALMNNLRTAGKDPVMQAVQDEVFDAGYWMPALGHATQCGLVHALSALVVYDTCIQSGPGGVAVIRNMFAELPPSKGGEEKKWTTAYVDARKRWLLSNKNPLVQRSAYRPESLRALIDGGHWELALPLTVRGKQIV